MVKKCFANQYQSVHERGFHSRENCIEMNSKLKLLLAINHINFRIYANRCAAQTYQMRERKS